MPNQVRFLVCVATILLTAVTVTSAAEISWTTDVGRAVNVAKQGPKPVIVDVWAVWCAPCKLMDETTYRDPKVIAAVEGFVPLKVDADVQERFIERHRVDAFPTILFLDARGREITRMTGLVSTPELLQTMQSVLDGYGPYLELVDSGTDAGALTEIGSYLLEVGNPVGSADHFRRALKSMKGAKPASLEKVELELAEAQRASEQFKAAAGTFERLADTATDPDVRARALSGLSRTQAERGKTDAAEAAMVRLRAEYPELAENLALESASP